MTRVLVVEDEESFSDALSYMLRREGYDTVVAANGPDALTEFDRGGADIVLLDLMLPGLPGTEVCKALRAKSSVPIIMLTAKAEEIDKVLGLEIGADDYITKPFSMREFRSRVRAALRRSEMSQADGSDEPLDRGDLHIDFAKRTTELAGVPVQLTYVEFEILAVLARHPGRVYTRDMLLDRIWGDSAFRDQRTIDVHIRHLREKLERDPRNPEYLLTVRGVGYRFRDE
jgi:DNA-binding response OmpR family regulator